MKEEREKHTEVIENEITRNKRKFFWMEAGSTAITVGIESYFLTLYMYTKDIQAGEWFSVTAIGFLGLAGISALINKAKGALEKDLLELREISDDAIFLDTDRIWAVNDRLNSMRAYKESRSLTSRISWIMREKSNARREIAEVGNNLPSNRLKNLRELRDKYEWISSEVEKVFEDVRFLNQISYTSSDIAVVRYHMARELKEEIEKRKRKRSKVAEVVVQKLDQVRLNAEYDKNTWDALQINDARVIVRDNYD